MLSEKSNEQAEKFRQEGNEFLSHLKFFDALVAFNKSLCCALPGSLELSLAYEGRSEVFLHVGEYEKYLENIQLAREHGCSEERTKMLNEREENCMKIMKEKNEDLDDDPWSFFKLSYPSNEKIPFIVECLELRENDI
jgi:hypothetical protein